MTLGLMIIAFILGHPFITILSLGILTVLLNAGVLYEEYLNCKRIYRDY